jgi:Na+/H+ antiporter NhaD/arsenite permease-like protein
LSVMQLEVLFVFLLVLFLIVVRRVGRFRVELWMAMLLGAVLLMALGTISFGQALSVLNLDLLAFLFGAFLIVQVMVQTGLLQYLAVTLIRASKSPSSFLLLVMVFVAVSSAFLVNDAVVLIMTPLVISACTLAKLRKTPYLIAVALASNLGSALTPIGNPQNILIKIASGVDTLYWVTRMALPTVLSILSAFLILRIIHRRDTRGSFTCSFPEPRTMITNRAGATAAGIVTLATIVAFLTSDLTGVPIALVAVVGGAAALLVSADRRQAIKEIDWGTLVFFAAMFIVMSTVASSGLLGYLFEPFGQWLFAGGAASVASIFGLSLLVSQVTSNVPFVSIALPAFQNAGASASQYLSLAAGSTLAGNMTILGAAANVIVLEAAEGRGSGFSYTEFFKSGFPVALATSAITIATLVLMG